MKKIFILTFILLFFISGCSNGTGSKDTIKQSDIKGYWLKIENDSSGEVTDLSNNKCAYLEITDERIFFYSYYSDTETYGVSDKYYKLEGNKLYYDYYELKGENWKENLDELSGGFLYVSIDDGKLITNEYNNDVNIDDGYEKNTYIKVDVKDWPIEE